MKELPAFRNYDIASFMIDLVNDCVESYKTDVAHDVKALYKLILNGKNQVFWGVRRCGTGMGYADSEYLDYYKENNMIVLFDLSELHIDNGEVYGNIAMIDYKQEYKNKWYNANSETKNWYHAGDDYDEFYNQCRKIARKFINDSN